MKNKTPTMSPSELVDPSVKRPSKTFSEKVLQTKESVKESIEEAKVDRDMRLPEPVEKLEGDELKSSQPDGQSDGNG